MYQIIMGPFLLFLILMSVPSLFQSCSDFFCKFCPYNYYSIFYTETLKISLMHTSNINNECLEKLNVPLSRKIFILNGTSTVSDDQSSYDMIYKKLAMAFENETRVLSNYSQGILEIVLQNGYHKIHENDFSTTFGEFFRKITVNISMISENNEFSTVEIKTNKFHIFISSSFLIKNIKFIGNDLILSSPLNNNFLNNSCQETDFANDYISKANMPNSACFLTNRVINVTNRLNYYGFLNIEYANSFNLGISANLTILNCEFYNFFPLNLDGSTSLISLAPLSGTLNIQNVSIDNSFFPQGIIYYSLYDFDSLYSSIATDMITKYFQNCSQNIFIQNLTLKRYHFYDTIMSMELFLMSLTGFMGNFSITNSVFVEIFNLSALFQVSKINNLILSNCKFQNLSELSILNSRQSNIVLLDFIEISICIPTENLFIIDTNTYFEISSSNFSNIILNLNNDCFFVTNSVFSYQDSLIFQSTFKSFISQSGINLNISNLTFQNIQFSEYLISFSGNNGVIIQNSCFSNISGNLYFFVLSKSSFIILFDSILSSIKIYSFFYALNSEVNLISRNVFKNNYFAYFWEKDFFANNVTSDEIFLFENTIAISIVRCFYQSLLFTVRDFFVLENQFIQLSAGGMVQMQNGDLLFQRVKLIDNDFPNTVTFSFLFELSINANMVFDESIIKDTGITRKKTRYLVFSDNVFFSVWYAPYTLFQNSLLMATDRIEIASGFVSATPHGGIFEFINNTLILQVSKKTTFNYKGLLLDHFLIAYLHNNTFYNMRCQPTAFSTINGGICLIASSSYTYSKGQNDYLVFMQNNSFYNSTCIEGGGLAIIGIKTIFLIDCYFYNSITQDKGGSFLIAGSENCTLLNILINGSKATLGGAAFFQNIIELDMENITLIDASTTENGVLYFNNIGVFNLNILFTYQTFAGINGGVIYLKYVNFSMQNGSIFNSVALIKGGFLICDGRSVVSIENLKIDNSSASQGGVIYILNANNLNISNLLVKNSFSFISGAILSVDHSKLTFFQNFTFINNSCDGIGMILFKEDDDNTSIFINWLACINNSAVDGSCLLFSSASFLILDNFFAENNVNTPLVLMGLITNHVDARNLVFNKTQTKDNVIYMNDIEISAQNLFCFENMLYEQLFFGLEIIGNLEQSVFMKNGNGTTIYIKGSDFVFKNFSFQNTSANVLILDGESSNIKFISSKVIEGHPLTAEKPLLYIFNSNFSAVNTIFRDNKALVILISNSILIFFDKCLFQKNQNEENSIANDIYIQNSLLGFYTNVIISETVFEITAGYSCDFSKSNFTNLTKATYKNLGQEILAQGINIESNLKIVISQCYFANFTQGAVLINNAYLPSTELILEISFSVFLYNQAAKGGALFLQGSMKISIISCAFENNKAINIFGNDKNELQGVGGCVFFKPEKLKNSPLKIFNSSFSDNTADFVGPTIFSQILVQYEQGSSILKGNFDGSNVTKQMFSYPLGLSILSVFSEGNETSNPKIFDVITFNSGTAFKIKIQIIDFFKQRLSFDNSSVLYWKKADNQNNLTVSIENTLNTSSQGIVIFDLIFVRVKPNTSFSLNIQGDFLGIAKYLLPAVLSQEFNFYSRVCLPGEIILNDFSCLKCLSKTFSLHDPMNQDQKFQKCTPCPNNCECFGGSNISPLPGYYRYSNLSVEVVSCLTPKACLGYQNLNLTTDTNDWSYIHGQCLSGNSGPLCDKCDYFYGKYDKGDTCLPCASLTSLVVVRVVGYLFLTSLYLYFNSYLVESYTEEKKQSEMEIFFKLIINHTQQVNVILSSGVVLPLPEIKKFFSYTDYFSTTNDHVYTNECLAQNILQSNKLNLNLLKILLNSFLPLLLSLVTFPIWVSYVFMKQKYYSANVRSRVDINANFVIAKIVLFVVISVFILYPLIVQSCFSLFQCYSLDPNLDIVFVKEDLEVECWGTTHIRNILLFSFPGLVIWGIGFPIFIFWKIKQYLKLRTTSYLVSCSFQTSSNKKSWKSSTDLLKSTQKLNNYKVFAFYYKGYKSEFYYWESLILMRKFLICFVSSLTESIKSEYKWMLFLIIFFFCLYVTQKKLPFTLNKGNILEIFSLSCIIFTVASCFIIESSTYSALQTGSAVITFMMHIFFFIYIIYHICVLLFATLKSKRESLKKIAQQKIKLKLQSAKSKK